MRAVPGNIILHLGSESVEFAPKDHQPGRPTFTLKPDLDTPAEWPKECMNLIEDPANKLAVINRIGTDYLLLSVPVGQEQAWIDRFNAIEGMMATLNTTSHMLEQADAS